MSADARLAELRADIELLKEAVVELRQAVPSETADAPASDEPLAEQLIRRVRPSEDEGDWKKPWWVALEFAATDLGYTSGWGSDIPQDIRDRAREILGEAGYHPSAGGRSPNAMPGFIPERAEEYETTYREHVRTWGWGAEAAVHIPAAEHYGWHVDGSWPYMSDELAERIRGQEEA